MRRSSASPIPPHESDQRDARGVAIVIGHGYELRIERGRITLRGASGRDLPVEIRDDHLVIGRRGQRRVLQVSADDLARILSACEATSRR